MQKITSLALAALLPAPLADAQKESHRQKSKIRARIEHVFGYMSRTMKGFSLPSSGRGATRRRLG